jgi:diadenosine tetraphosphatase ApaH/serine/threonine PP2A family protein phosphatase
LRTSTEIISLLRRCWPTSARQASPTIEAGTPDARYAILELISGRWSVTFRHVPYDHQMMAALARQNGDPEYAGAVATGRVR